jgi:hypothetical protein
MRLAHGSLRGFALPAGPAFAGAGLTAPPPAGSTLPIFVSS